MRATLIQIVRSGNAESELRFEIDETNEDFELNLVSVLKFWNELKSQPIIFNPPDMEKQPAE